MTIRSAAAADAERLLEIYAWYVEHTAITYEYEAPSLKEFQDRIFHTLEHFPYLVLEEDGVIQGYAYAGPFHSRAAYSHCCELSIYLDHSTKGHGYGRRAQESRIPESVCMYRGSDRGRRIPDKKQRTVSPAYGI